MDPEDALWMDLPNEDTFGEESDRRDDPEEPWYWTRIGNVEGLGDWQDAGDDIRRRERMAEAMYEC